MLEKMLDQADASDEQRAQITDIMQAAHEDVAALREGSREALHTQVLDILTAETIDAAALDALRSEQQQQLEQAMARMSDALVQAANVLSQEQRVAIAEAVRERFESHGGRHGPRF
jgi:Spy/CpxP family protein refolding chaperone